MARSAFLGLALLAVLPLSACTGGGTQRAAVRPDPGASSPTRAVGGPQVPPAAVPTTPMDSLERPIAAQLRRRAAAEGLHLGYLACPHWDHHMPARLTCTGYFDGVRAPVLVRLTDLPGGSVSFDAHIGHGVVATHNLVAELRAHGYHDVDCGDRPAYPARVGLKVVCGVRDGAQHRYVVATVTDRSGGVSIRDL